MEVMKDGHIALSDNRWTDNELGIEWLKQCFDPETRSISRKPRILIMDGHCSHISTEALKFCIASNIIVLCLPAHSTHITQPLDVGIFRPLAMAYSKGVLERGEYSLIYSVNKIEFLEIYQHARQAAITIKNIVSAWKQAGLIPFDPVEHKSRADFAPEFAPDFKLPLSKPTATNNIMLGNHDQ
jgi:DDE superfamily endonuclease